MPELPPTILNPAFNSKSSTSPSVQMQNVLCFGCFAGVHSPTRAPSCTDQKVGSAFQPERSRPLKIDRKPASAAGSWAVACTRSRSAASGNETNGDGAFMAEQLQALCNRPIVPPRPGPPQATGWTLEWITTNVVLAAIEPRPAAHPPQGIH